RTLRSPTPMSPPEKSDHPAADPSRGQIIVPGAETASEEASPDAPRAAPRIVLPPGVQAPVADDLPEYPKLRPLILVPFNDGERDLVLVTDPLGVIPGQPVLAMESLPLLQVLDGSTSLNDLATVLMRENKDLRMMNVVREFVAELDRLLMLDSPRFEAAYRGLREAYHPLEI